MLNLGILQTEFQTLKRQEGAYVDDLKCRVQGTNLRAERGLSYITAGCLAELLRAIRPFT